MPQQPFLALITPLGQSGPVDPGYSPPWAQVPPGGQGGGPVDPGYSPPWARPPVDPGYSPPWARPPSGGGPVDPGYSPPWARPPSAPVDPGYSPPWARPGGGPVDPGYGIDVGTGPVRPVQPIYFPPGPIDPGYSPPWAQVPDLPPTVPPAQGGVGEPVPVEWKTAWTPVTGWIVVGVPTGNVPTPSAA